LSLNAKDAEEAIKIHYHEEDFANFQKKIEIDQELYPVRLHKTNLLFLE